MIFVLVENSDGQCVFDCSLYLSVFVFFLVVFLFYLRFVLFLVPLELVLILCEVLSLKRKIMSFLVEISDELKVNDLTEDKYFFGFLGFFAFCFFFDMTDFEGLFVSTDKVFEILVPKTLSREIDRFIEEVVNNSCTRLICQVEAEVVFHTDDCPLQRSIEVDVHGLS